MNITQQIAEIIRQGKPAAIPGAGVLTTQRVPAHYDEATGTFLPSRQTVVFTPQKVSLSELTQSMAQRMKMSLSDTERLMTPALAALQQALDDGGLTIPGIGSLTKGEYGFTFTESPDLLASANPLAQPLTVKQTYTPTRDPFAEAPEPMPEPEPQTGDNLDNLENVENVEIIENIENIEPEPEPEPLPEPEPEPEPLPEPEPEPEPLPEPEPVDALRALEEMQEEEEADPAPVKPAAPYTPPKKKKKGLPAWLWVLIVVLLLGGGAGSWYFLGGGDQTLRNLLGSDNSAPAEWASSKHLTDGSLAERDHLMLPFTLSDDLFEYSSSEVDYYATAACELMADYLADFAREQHYTSAAAPLQERAAAYAQERLGQLLQPAFGPAALISTDDDFMARLLRNNLRERKAFRAQHTLQAELMDAARLRQMLDEVVAANELQPDAATPAQPKAPAQFKPTASYRTASKQGFDVIAGFFTVKANADRLATTLKRQGCDAYIIEINSGYYVSMGSKSSRTEVEKLYNHLLEWYRGDMAIKQF